MSTLHGDPESMRQFASLLHEFCRHTRDAAERVQAAARDIGASGEWHDENYQRFCDGFNPHAEAIAKHTGEIEEDLVRLVRQLADKYEELLRG